MNAAKILSTLANGKAPQRQAAAKLLPTNGNGRELEQLLTVDREIKQRLGTEKAEIYEALKGVYFLERFKKILPELSGDDKESYLRSARVCALIYADFSFDETVPSVAASLWQLYQQAAKDRNTDPVLAFLSDPKNTAGVQPLKHWTKETYQLVNQFTA